MHPWRNLSVLPRCQRKVYNSILSTIVCNLRWCITVLRLAGMLELILLFDHLSKFKVHFECFREFSLHESYTVIIRAECLFTQTIMPLYLPYLTTSIVPPVSYHPERPPKIQKEQKCSLFTIITEPITRNLQHQIFGLVKGRPLRDFRAHEQKGQTGKKKLMVRGFDCESLTRPNKEWESV